MEHGDDYLTDRKFRDRFNSMRLAREMTDVVIAVENREFPAHKLILAGCSPYFRGMFREGSNFDERQRDRVQIDPKGELGIRADAVEQLINYVYTGKVEISHHNVIDLIRAADLLELAEIKNKTLGVIERHISFDTYLDIRDVGNVFDCPRLSEAVDKFIRKNFAQFARTETFLTLEEDEVRKYLKHECLRTETEEEVFQAALDWCKKNGPLSAFVALASDCIRFHLLSVKFLAGVLADDTDVRADSAVSEFLLKEMRSPANVVVSASRPRLSTRVLVAMPFKADAFHLAMFYGDHVEFKQRPYPDSLGGATYDFFSVCQLDSGRLLVAGGILNGDYNHKAYIYSVASDEWSQFAHTLPGDLENFGMACLGDRVYILGGAGNLALNNGATAFSVQVDARTGADWTETAAMNVTRNSVSLVASNNRLYAIGGMNNGAYSDVMEVYDPDANVWDFVGIMNHHRCQPGIAVGPTGLIYVVGGLGNTFEGISGALKSAEVFDPARGEWSSLPDMYFCRHKPAVAVVDSKLFVFGGGSPSPLLRPGPEKAIECLDLTRNEWQVLPEKMPGNANSVYAADFFADLDTST